MSQYDDFARLTNADGKTKIRHVLPSLDRHQRLRALFEAALPMAPAAREDYLNQACADDAVLHADVVRLLARHRDAGSFLERPLDPLLAQSEAPPFTGTDRFLVACRLGAGGMGVVYEVHDRHRHETVALKTLRHSGAADVFRLKQEFRSLAGVTHPNLVCLYELFVDDEQCFFTMELVRGATFVDYSRGTNGAGSVIGLLTDALCQLVEAVSAIHRHGKLHRDIKPSNVLVTPAGRVVVLDFGLMAELRPFGAAPHVNGGTPAYMSPEEAAGAMPTVASDWYGVGVTLYEALTGTAPFEGSPLDVLRRKQIDDPRPPSEMSPDVPADLSALCMGLLHRDPARRLIGATALRTLQRDDRSPDSNTAFAAHDRRFVGRRRELVTLIEASDVVLNGRAASVAVSGPSGIGKTTLVDRFLGQFANRNDAVVLHGRCYENESVPYKALDGVVDALSSYIGSLPSSEIESVLPADLSALTQVFPVLLQVGRVAAGRALEHVWPARADTRTGRDIVDPLRVRRRAFDALRALLRQIAVRRKLAIWIDDLQWADADSVVLLDDLLGPPDPPAMLTLLCFRSEEVPVKPFLRAALDAATRNGWSVSLDGMDDAEAGELIQDRLRPGGTLSDEQRRRLTSEAGGSPFVLEQLAMHANSATPASALVLTFGAMFESRLRGLPPDARQFLDALAICGRPMTPDIVCDACGIEHDRQSLVMRLRGLQLIRSSGSSERVETYHDRIREALVGQIGADGARRIHRHLAAATEARHSDDCEALFEHYRGAGEFDRAAVQAGLAAAKAGAALAFDRAASFYRHALELAPSSGPEFEWKEGLAVALANAGRPEEAADAYLRAADGADPARRVDLQRRAAEQFLIGGHIDRGLALIRRVLKSVGMSYARSPRTAAARLLWRRLRLRWRGLGFEPRRAEDVDRTTLLHLDTCWAVAAGLGLVDVSRASDFIAQHLHLALDAGEMSRISRGLAIESSVRSSDWVFRKSASRLADRAKALAERVDTPQALAFDRLADGITASALGQWLRARQSSEQALAILRDRCIGVTWEMNMAQNVFIWALMYLGEIGEVSRLVPALLAEARRRGNLYLATELCTRCNYVWLAADDPDEGERQAIEAVSRWSQEGFHRQHYSAMLARVQTALYRGDGDAAWRLLRADESRLAQSMLLRVQALRIETRYLTARSALAIAASDPSARRRFLPIARRSAGRIARERMPWSDPIALLVDAGIASVEGRDGDATSRLSDAADRFERADMKLYLAVARRRLGQIRQDELGREQLGRGNEWMALQGISNPVALTRMLAPGFPDPS